MKTFIRLFLLISLLSLALTACGQEKAPAYEIVSPASLKPGDELPAPTGQVILTVDNKGEELTFDMETLEKLGTVEYTVMDPWFEVEYTYSGVLLTDFLAFIGADIASDTVHITALDDYQVDLTSAEMEKETIMLATQANGEYMAVDDGGPTRIMFPFGDYSEGDKTHYEDLAIWNISIIEIK